MNGKSVTLPAVMGILNITPDSFSDGGMYNTPDKIKYKVNEHQKGGAQIIDIGAESSRPGAKMVSTQQELDRLIPHLESIRKQYDGVISIDSYKPKIMSEAAKLGVEMINDIYGLTQPRAIETIATYKLNVCIMHMKGTPATMQQSPVYHDVITAVKTFLKKQAENAIEAGVSPQSIILDPGIGFGKTQPDNIKLIANLDQISELGFEVCLGISRKSITKYLASSGDDESKLMANNALLSLGYQKGARIFRTHDVENCAQLVDICSKIYNS